MGASQLGIACEQWRVHPFSKGDIRTVVGRDRMTQPPNSPKRRQMRVSNDTQIFQVDECLDAACLGQSTLAHETPKNLGHLYVQKMRRMN